MNVRYSARANRHIDAIHDYIAKRDPDTATRVIAHIRKTLAHLATFPFMGRLNGNGTGRVTTDLESGAPALRERRSEKRRGVVLPGSLRSALSESDSEGNP